MKRQINQPVGERLLTYAETAELWNCCIRTVIRKIQSGEVEVVELSERMPRIRESVVQQHVADRIRKVAS
jgi:hypothetical protein